MTNLLSEIIKVKTFRKNMAETALLLQRAKVIEAQSALKKAEEELERYIKESTEEEKKLFQQILNKKIKLKKIEDMQYKVGELRQGVEVREENKKDAQHTLVTEEKQLEVALTHYQDTLRIEEKFLSLSRIEEEAALIEAERLSELELEEIPLNRDNIDEGELRDE